MMSLTSLSSARNKRRDRRLIVTLMLMVAATGLLIGSPGERPHAQQDRDRQLERNDSSSPNSSKRIALVIGNGAYTSAPPLKNPPNDARDMAATLRALGFDVTNGINVNQRDIKRLIREFGQKLKAGGSGLFYYAGHGVQSKGRNYLIPVDANIASEAEVEDSGVDVSLVLNFMDDAQNGLNIVILDACRNNPFSRSFRSASDGLAQVDAPTGTLIAYATAPGRVASDGTGQNGLYTSELLKQMLVPGLSATEMFMRVRAEVMKQTSSKQVPWEASSLVGTFYFSGPRSDGAPATLPANEMKVDPLAFELSYWETIKNSTNADDFKAYMEKYPNGQFASLAKNRIASLDAPTKPIETRAAPANDSATELAFWDSVKTSTSAADYRAYLQKYPDGTFAELAKNRLASLEAAGRPAVEQDSIVGTWKGSSPVGDVKYEFQFMADGQVFWQTTIRKTLVPQRGTWKRNGNTIYMELSAAYSSNCCLLAEAVINQSTMTGSYDSGKYKFTMEKQGAAAKESSSLEGTTWKGDSAGGDKHYEFQFLPNGEVVWHLKWSRLNDPVLRGTWQQTGDTIHMDFPGVHSGLSPVEAKISGDKMTGSFAFGSATGRWDNGMYKFTVAKVP